MLGLAAGSEIIEGVISGSCVASLMTSRRTSCEIQLPGRRRILEGCARFLGISIPYAVRGLENRKHMLEIFDKASDSNSIIFRRM